MHLVQRFSKALIPVLLVFQPAICCADNVLVVKFVSFHEFFQFTKQIVTWSQDNASAHTSAQALAVIQNAGFEILRHKPYSPFVFALHGKWLAGRPRTTVIFIFDKLTNSMK